MIGPCTDHELLDIYTVVNDAAQAYRGVIPADHWKDPYMRVDELRAEIAAGVQFLGFRARHQLIGVIGLQDVLDASLIRHAYVRTAYRNQGVGGQLLAELRAQARRPLLVGTWAAAHWAIRFYEKHGFNLVPEAVRRTLLSKYWSIPASQAGASVVLSAPEPIH